MTVQIVEVNSCKRNLAVEVPIEDIDREIDNLAKEYARKAKVPGFRPGKVPLSVVKQRYGNELRQDATQELIRRCWKEAVTEHDLHPLREPVVEDVQSYPNGPLKFTISFEILPAIEVKDYKEVPATLERPKVEEEDVDKGLESLRQQHAQFIPLEDGEAKDGHYVTLTIDGEFEDGSQPIHDDNVTLILGHPETNVEFSESLRGARLGEERTFNVTYPEEHKRERLAGKKVRYNVKVKDIKEMQLAELNDEFAKDVGSESLQALREKVRNEMVRQVERSAEEKARGMVLDSIVQRHSLEIPECMVQDELEGRAQRIASDLARQGIDVSQASIDWKKAFEAERPHAEQAVRRSIVLDAIARQEGLEVSEEEIDSEIQKIAEGTSKSAASLRAQLEKEQRIQVFREHLRQNKALDFIYRNANISEG